MFVPYREYFIFSRRDIWWGARSRFSRCTFPDATVPWECADSIAAAAAAAIAYQFRGSGITSATRGA